jgi:hypothetical protein
MIADTIPCFCPLGHSFKQYGEFSTDYFWKVLFGLEDNNNQENLLFKDMKFQR